MKVLVLGGYGVFGAHVSRELRKRGVAVTVAGRDPAKADVVADARDVGSVRAALKGHSVVAHCAGPYTGNNAVLDAALAEGAHYVDLADERAYVAALRARESELRAKKLCAVYGASSFPGLSVALALRAARGHPGPPELARVSLFIGNDNAKGLAAVTTAARGLGRRFHAPQGELTGFRGREVVDIPAFGRRALYDFDTPEYDLFPALIGAKAVRVKVGFELRTGTALFAALAALGPRWGDRTARVLSTTGNLFRAFGSSGGAVVADLFWPGGEHARDAVYAERDTQRMAALPCALAAEALARGARAQGALLPHELLGADSLLASIAGEGFVAVDS